jgi:hypothetical protein
MDYMTEPIYERIDTRHKPQPIPEENTDNIDGGDGGDGPDDPTKTTKKELTETLTE